jgi:hypothetical protein
MMGIIGHGEPLLTLVDWSEVKIDVEAVSIQMFRSYDIYLNLRL